MFTEIVVTTSRGNNKSTMFGLGWVTDKMSVTLVQFNLLLYVLHFSTI